MNTLGPQEVSVVDLDLLDDAIKENHWCAWDDAALISFVVNIFVIQELFTHDKRGGFLDELGTAFPC